MPGLLSLKPLSHVVNTTLVVVDITVVAVVIIIIIIIITIIWTVLSLGEQAV